MFDRNESRSGKKEVVLKSQRALARADSKMVHASPSSKHSPFTLLRSGVINLR